MKRHNSQSTARAVKRGNVRFTVSEFLKDENGTPLIIKERRGSRNRLKWIKS